MSESVVADIVCNDNSQFGLQSKAEAQRPEVVEGRPSPRHIHGWKVNWFPITISFGHNIVKRELQWVAAYSAMLSTTFLFALDNTIVRPFSPDSDYTQCSPVY